MRIVVVVVVPMTSRFCRKKQRDCGIFILLAGYTTRDYCGDGDC